MQINLRNAEFDAFREEARKYTEEEIAVRVKRSAVDLTTPEGRVAARDITTYGVDWSRTSELVRELGIAPEDRLIHSRSHSVPIRILRPRSPAKGVYLDLHGGGFYCGFPAMDDLRNASYAAAASIAIVSVDYRLAPEWPWPAATDDCESVAQWLLAHAEDEFGADRLIIGGASAGANLAVVTLLRLRDALGNTGRFVGANLLYGAYDLSGQSPSGRIHHAAGLAHHRAYVGDLKSDRLADPYISPLYADLAHMPPAIFSVGSADQRFYEENTAMAMRWAAAGNECDLDVYPEAGHGFDHHPTKMAEVAQGRISAWMTGLLSH
jgi:acetyl esterase